jgi:hypothetical protein
VSNIEQLWNQPKFGYMPLREMRSADRSLPELRTYEGEGRSAQVLKRKSFRVEDSHNNINANNLKAMGHAVFCSRLRAGVDHRGEPR